MADYTPVYGKPQNMTFTAGAAITGGQALVLSANDTVIPAAGVSAAFIGMAAHDAASGALVTVHMGAGVVHETQTSAAAVSAGSLISTAASGQIQAASSPTAGQDIGVAIRTVSGSGGVLRWKSTV